MTRPRVRIYAPADVTQMHHPFDEHGRTSAQFAIVYQGDVAPRTASQCITGDILKNLAVQCIQHCLLSVSVRAGVDQRSVKPRNLSESPVLVIVTIAELIRRRVRPSPTSERRVRGTTRTTCSPCVAWLVSLLERVVTIMLSSHAAVVACACCSCITDVTAPLVSSPSSDAAP